MHTVHSVAQRLPTQCPRIFITFNVADYDKVLSGLNYLVAKKTPLTVSHAREKEGLAALTICFKEKTGGSLADGSSLSDVENLFHPYEVKLQSLNRIPPT